MAPPTGTSTTRLRRENYGSIEQEARCKITTSEILTRHKTEGVVDTANVEKIRRHKQALQAIVQGVDEVKREVEQAKLEDGESLEKVAEWGRGIEEQIDVADEEIKQSRHARGTNDRCNERKRLRPPARGAIKV